MKKYLFLLVVTLCAIESENQAALNQKGVVGRVLAAMATSRAIDTYNRFFAKMFPLEGVSASEEIQILGKEAQTVLGIPVDRQVPIQYISGLTASAIADAHSIVVGDELINDRVAYGLKRCNMFHEAVHVKYHDKAFNSLFLLGSLLGVTFASKLLINPQGKLKLLYVPMLLVGHYVGRTLQHSFEGYRERRADIEGHYATQCYRCVSEKIEDVREAYKKIYENMSYCDQNANLLTEEHIAIMTMQKDWIECRKSYLSIEENEIIAAELQQAGKVCRFHEQSTMLKLFDDVNSYNGE